LLSDFLGEQENNKQNEQAIKRRKFLLISIPGKQTFLASNPITMYANWLFFSIAVYKIISILAIPFLFEKFRLLSIPENVIIL